MRKVKKIVSYILKMQDILEPESERILLTGCILVCACFAVSILFLLCGDLLFPDRNTAEYWCLACAQLAKDFLGASFVPVLFVELLLAACGRKRNL